MKKLLMGILFLFSLLVVAAMLAPLFFNVDQYRPELVQAISEHVNGRVEIGKLSLSLWGNIHVQIDGVKVSDTHGKNILSVQDASFHLPFTSVLEGSPSLILTLDHPIISVTKEKTGKLNIMELTAAPTPAPGKAPQTVAPAPQNGKVAANKAPAPAPAPVAPTTAKSAPVAQANSLTSIKLPGIVTNARVGIEIKNAQFSYKDENTGMTSETKNLSLIAHDVSLNHKMTLEFLADLNTEDKKGGISVHGPIKLTATADPKVTDGKVSSMEVAATVSLDDLVISIPGLFQKDKGIDAHADLDIRASTDSIQIDKISAKFYNAQFDGKGVISNFAPAAGSTASPNVNFTMKSNFIELAAWSKVVPMLKQYDLGGDADLSIEANGPADKLGYKGLFKINNLVAKAPNLKAEPHIDLVLSVITDQIDNFTFTMKAPGNDLNVHGKVIGFNAPHIDFQVTSGGMDLDQLINMSGAPATAQAKSAEKPAAESKSATEAKSVTTSKTENVSKTANSTDTAAATASDTDSSLDSLRTNKILQSTVANIGINLKSIKAKGATISNLSTKLSMHDMMLAIDSFSMNVFSGSIKANMNVNLRPKAPTYKLSASVAGLDMKQAVESQMAAFKNTVMGKVNFDMNGEGSSFNTKSATHNLVASGRLKIQDATFATVDVGKMVADGLSGTMGKLAGKIPGLNGKPAPGVAGGSKYDLISSSFTIKGGHFSAPDFVGKAKANAGIDLKGDLEVGLEDYSLKADWMLIDTYNLTHAKDVGVSAAGISAPHILASGNGPVQFPVSVGCTLTAPCYSYSQTPDYLMKIAMGNVSGGAKSAAVNQAKGLLRGLIPGGNKPNSSASNGNPLKKLFGN